MASLLFLIYINGIPNSITNMLRLYADDDLLYSIINSNVDCVYRLTYQLCKNGARHGKWSLIQPSVNIFRLPTGTTLLILTCKCHINIIAAKANAAQAFLQRNTSFCPTEVKIHCYNIFVQTIMEYSATVWSPHTVHDITKLEKV